MRTKQNNKKVFHSFEEYLATYYPNYKNEQNISESDPYLIGVELAEKVFKKLQAERQKAKSQA